MTSTRFAAAIFDGPPVMLMTRADRPVPSTERFERDVRPGLDRVYAAALSLTGDPAEAGDLVERRP